MTGCLRSAARRSMRSISTRRLAGSRMRGESSTPSSARSYAGRVLRVRIPDQLVVLGVQVDLADVGDVAHERSGKAAAHAATEPAARHGDVLSGGGSDDHLAGSFRRDQVDDGALSREDSAGGEGDGSGESGVARGFNAAIGDGHLVGDLDPTGGLG